MIKGINVLVDNVIVFREDFDKNGPMVSGIEPREALNRLRMFTAEFEIRDRKFKSYQAGETLFGLPHQSYPELEKTQK